MPTRPRLVPAQCHASSRLARPFIPATRPDYADSRQLLPPCLSLSGSRPAPALRLHLHLGQAESLLRGLTSTAYLCSLVAVPSSQPPPPVHFARPPRLKACCLARRPPLAGNRYVLSSSVRQMSRARPGLRPELSTSRVAKVSGSVYRRTIALAACLLRRAGPHVDRLRATGYLYVLAQAPRHDNACTLPCEPPVAGRRYVVSSKTGVASESRPSPPRDMLSGRSYVAVSEPHARTGGVQPCTVPASTACNELRGPVWTGYGILVGIPSAETSRPRSAATCHRCLKLARRLSGPYDDDFSPPSSCRRLRGIRRLSTASSLACQASGPGLPSSRYPP